MPEPPPPKKTPSLGLPDQCLDNHADLTLLVGPQKIIFKVCSHVMRMASPVWEEMLTGSFREATAAEIPLPEDKPAALLIVLKITHMRYNQLPTERMAPNELVDLAEVCDKYDLVSIVRPWLGNWTGFSGYCGSELDSYTHVDLSGQYFIKDGPLPFLFVAWVFGFKARVEWAAQDLLKKMTVDDLGAPDFGGTTEFMNLLLPPGSIEHIQAVRMDINAQIKKLCESHYKKALEEVTSTAAGAVSLAKMGAIAEASQRVGCILFSKMKTLPLGDLEAEVNIWKATLKANWEPKENKLRKKAHDAVHEFSIDLYELIYGVPAPVQESDILHMKKQAAK